MMHGPLPEGVLERWDAGEGNPNKLELYLALGALDHHRTRKTAFQLCGHYEEAVLDEWAKESVRPASASILSHADMHRMHARAPQEMTERIIHLLPVWMRHALEDAPVEAIRLLFARDQAALPVRHALLRSGVSVTPPTPERPGPDAVFLHYNDAYQVEEGTKEPIGGISRCVVVGLIVTPVHVKARSQIHRDDAAAQAPGVCGHFWRRPF